jgi:hypothetical protein
LSTSRMADSSIFVDLAHPRLDPDTFGSGALHTRKQCRPGVPMTPGAPHPAKWGSRPASICPGSPLILAAPMTRNESSNTWKRLGGWSEESALLRRGLRICRNRSGAGYLLTSGCIDRSRGPNRRPVARTPECRTNPNRQHNYQGNGCPSNQD